ncbi:glycine/betaine ABC transporter permease [Oceanidesulfovibrio indonesiensis]|uniref:Glycine/betaine ABC transporter permease n=1 Tax=Oceanidesulfovibrio indonesiensis TaxID=54767 RepID=A0A7M3MGC0_9BACT|nr:BCCT family transporter [Oceanidesulfovibrio indonesiensis]TVM18366.1 glycine/betaine ABC transporter permease [Oceanidesulfovibrio indonesiensis]
MPTVRRHIVFVASLVVVLALSLYGIVDPTGLDEVSAWLHERIIRHFGWGYLTAAFLFLVFSLYLAFSKYGNIKLGGDHERPYYSYFGWFSMLFAAGMGIGMIFWGVAEPMSHYLNPPEHIRESSGEAAGFAMRYSFFHWGLQPWAIYIVMSLSIAYFSFRRGMPMLISSCFYPLIGDRIFGSVGRAIDILAVFATVFGIVTSLGLGAMQITSGLGAVFGFSSSYPVILAVIAVVTVLFMISSMTGLDKGIQILSKTNILLALTLLAFMFVVGPSTFILEIFTNTIADYMTSLVSMSLSTNPFQGHKWTQSWTLFYWAWWISWSPFVGMFVASISRGRTIREFIVAALLVPPLLTFVWFSVFGGAAFLVELNGGGLAAHVADDVSTGLFKLYAHYPMSEVLSLITVVLLGVFFVTSADSATFVLAMMTTHGDATPPASKKIVWGLTVSLTAAILLYSGGLEALQRMAIAAALPFTIIMVLLCRSLHKGLSYEMRKGAMECDPEGEKDSE